MVLSCDNRSGSCRVRSCPAWDERVERGPRKQTTHDDFHRQEKTCGWFSLIPMKYTLVRYADTGMSRDEEFLLQLR